MFIVFLLDIVYVNFLPSGGVEHDGVLIRSGSLSASLEEEPLVRIRLDPPVIRHLLRR
jgi:hypothetical protein